MTETKLTIIIVKVTIARWNIWFMGCSIWKVVLIYLFLHCQQSYILIFKWCSLGIVPATFAPVCLPSVHRSQYQVKSSFL